MAEQDEGWMAVSEAASESEAALMAGFLESSGIPAKVVDRSFHEVPTESEELTGIAVAVPRSRAAEARRVLAGRESAFLSSPEGDAKVLTDEGLAEIDPETPKPEG